MQIVELTKEGYIFCAHNMKKVSNPEKPTASEIYNDKDNFNAILFLPRPNEGRYRKLVQYLNED